MKMLFFRMPPHPHFDHAWPAPLAGVDEAGRGPWAGPVVAAAVIFTTQHIPDGITDSKRIKPAQREALYTQIRACAHVGVGIAEVAEIDAMNILQATKCAMQRAVFALPILPLHVLIDGNQSVDLPCPCSTVIGGDAKSLSIAAASIIAKVTRDRMMHTLHTAFPYYGWDTNAGYGTPAHQAALRLHGVTVHHRRSFKPIAALVG